MKDELKGSRKLSDDEMENVVGGMAVSPAVNTIYQQGDEPARATSMDYRRKQGTTPQAQKMGGTGKKKKGGGATAIC